MARTAYVLGVDPGTIVANLRAMVQLVKASAAIPILGAIPPNHRPFASMAQAIIDAVNAQLPAVATEEGILFADTFSPLTNGGLYGSDQLHPNQQGYDVHVHVPSASYVLGGLVLILSERGVETAGPPEGRRRGLGLALVAALAWAVSAALMKPPVQEIDPLTIQAVRLPGSALILWATPQARGTARTLWAQRRTVGRRVVVLSALTALSAVAYLSGLKYAGVTLGTVLSSVSPLFALPIRLLAFGERVTWRATAGAALAVAGIGILSL